MSFGSAHIVLKNNRKLLASSRGRKRRLIDSYVKINSNESLLTIEDTVNKPWVNRRIADTIQRRNFRTNLMTVLVFMVLSVIIGFAVFYMIS